MRADGLGLPAFPVGSGPDIDLGDHVMGAVVVAWLTYLPVSRWGEAWASSGAIEVQFRSHLTVGEPLTATVTPVAEQLQVAIQATGGRLAATASAQMARDGGELCLTRSEDGPRQGEESLLEDRLSDSELSPITFEFDAHRDLAFTAGMADGQMWRSHGWAHPAWLVCGTNAWVRKNIDFGTADRWTNAGVRIQHHEPVEDGSAVTLAGAIAEVFDRGRNRFATAAITAWARGRIAASMENTFVYETTIDPHA